MYYRYPCWGGRWFDKNGDTGICGGITDLSAEEIEEFRNLYREIATLWPGGCNFDMEQDVKQYEAEIPGNSNRYLLITEGRLLHCLVFIDLEHKNADYPVRLHVYKTEQMRGQQ